jgi:hypothetical protein
VDLDLRVDRFARLFGLAGQAADDGVEPVIEVPFRVTLKKNRA